MKLTGGRRKMYREYDDDQEYELQKDSRADTLYDEMRDDFLFIESEEDARRCFERYGLLQSQRFMPEPYQFLLKENK